MRIVACKAITIFIRKIEKHKLKFSAEQEQKIHNLKAIEGIMSIELANETNTYTLEALIEMVKILGAKCLPEDITSAYMLENVHRNISHPPILKICFSLLELICKYPDSYSRLIMAEGQGS